MERRRLFKPAVKAAIGATLYKKYNDWKSGEYIVGKYLKQVESTNKWRGKTITSQNYHIEIVESNLEILDKEGKKVKDLVGKIFSLAGNGKINKFFENVKVGMLVDIEYFGKEQDKEDPDTFYHTFSRLEAGYDAEEVTEVHVDDAESIEIGANEKLFEDEASDDDDAWD